MNLKNKSNSDATIITKISLFIFKFFNIIGVIKAAMAVTNRMFAILLPIMFPSAISGDPINTASTETVSSAKLVPNPMITALTSIFESLNLRAITKTPLRTPSPPMYKKNKLKGIIIKSNIIN